MSGRKNHPDRTSSTLVAGCAGGFIFALVGLVIGVLVGGRAGFHEADGAGELTFDQGSTGEQSLDFWIVTYDAQDVPTLQWCPPIPFELAAGESAIPRGTSKEALGPWEGMMPSGEHDFKAGGVTFEIGTSESRATLILYPASPKDGWIREYYVYDIAGDSIMPASSKRERSFNEWGMDFVVVYALMGGIVGLLVGTAGGSLLAQLTARRSRR